MMRLEKTYVQTQIGSLLIRIQQLQWLIEHNVKAEKVANFGCNIGGETLALMWTLGASEAIGIDIDRNNIQQAQSTLVSMQDEMIRIWRMLSCYPNEITPDDKAWWNNEVPDFIKKAMLQKRANVTYLVNDITQATELPQDYYDIAFCDFVLHHIWYSDKRKDAEGDTQFAVKEMARVVKAGGTVATRELLQFSDKPKLDFEKLFEKAGLRMLHKNEFEVDGLQGHGIVAEYICKKPDTVSD